MQIENPFNQLLETPPPPTFLPNKTALLVVDMQYFDAHPEWGEGRTAIEMGVAHCFDPYFEQIDEVIPRIQQLLGLFRQKEMEVIHLRVAEWTKDSRDVGWKQLVRGLIVPSDSKEADLLEEVAPIDDELVVSKSSSGVFPVTNLDRLLRNLGITSLIFTGTATGGCVESAVRDAVDLGYDVVVVSDACADSTRESHQLALDRMQGGLTHIMTTAAVKDAIAALEDGSRKVRSGIERVQEYLPKPPAEKPGPDVNPYALIFPPAIKLSLTRQNTGLTLIDAQQYICNPAHGLGKFAHAHNNGTAQNTVQDYYKRVECALANMQQLLAACRTAGIQVLHFRTAGQLPDGRDLSRHLRSQGIAIWQDDPGAEFMPQVTPIAGELILNKPSSGIFTGTGCDEILRNLGLEHLIIAGTSFAGALEGSIRSATDRGYGAVVVPDASAAFHPLLQEKLYSLESGIIQVTDTDETIAQLQALT